MQITATTNNQQNARTNTKRSRNTMNSKTQHNHKNHKRSKHAAPKKTNKRAAASVAMMTDDKDDDMDTCLICCEPIRVYAVGSCDHRSVCWQCCLRRRKLYDQNDCCLCKQQLDTVVFTSDRSALFESFNLGLLRTLPNLSGILFEEEAHKEEAEKLFTLCCPICADQSFSSIWALKEHVKKHQLHYCSLCLTHKKVFLSEQTLFTRGDLQTHLKPGNRGKSQNGEKEPEHQFCHFCKKRFFDKDQLYAHLQDKHEKCHLCEKQGSPNQYFDNYAALEKHFDKDHHLCHDPTCLEKKFIVFGTALDLQAHEISVHVATRKMSKAEKREASKLDVGLVFSNASSSSRRPPSPPPPNPPSSSTAAHRTTNEPLINFAETQSLAESWNFPSLPGSGNESGSTTPTNNCNKRTRKSGATVVLGRNEWFRNSSSSSSSSRAEAWPTLPPTAVVASKRRASPPSPPPNVAGYGGHYGTKDSYSYGGSSRNKKGEIVLRW